MRVKRSIGIGLAALCLLAALLACNLSQSPEAQPEDAVPTLGTLYNTRVPTLVPATATPSNTPTHTPVRLTNTPPPSDTPSASNTPPPTPIPPARAPAAPAATAVPTSPPSSGPLSFKWSIVGIPREDPNTNTSYHTIAIYAEGGNGIYTYYRDGQQLSSNQFVLEWVTCGGQVTTSVRVDSGDGQSTSQVVGFNAFCPTPYGCNPEASDCHPWSP